MEDQVPFKVFTFWKQNEKPEVRRFGVEKSVVTSFHYLNAKLHSVYPGLKSKNYSVAWKDEDGDDVVISSDDEVMTALQALNGDVIKLFVYCKSEENIGFTAASGNPNEAAPGTPAVHYGVMCDSCDGTVVGFRYKCTTCDDYDLCSRCEAAGQHPDHFMVRVPTPTMPRTIIRAAIKRSRHFLKNVASAMAEDCPYKKHRADKSGERREGHRGPHHGGHSGERGEHAGHREHHRRNRVTWLDTFSTYMNEFANLAGDVNLDDGKPKAPETATQGQTTETQGQNPQESREKAQSSTESAQAPKQAEPSTSAYAQTQCPILPVNINLDQIKGLLELYLGGNLNNFMPQPPQAPAPAANTAAAAAPQSNDVEMGQGDRKSPESDEVTVKTETSSISSNNENARDASPDKADDWTVINKEKDLMDTACAAPEPAAPIGFNLPEEFQERVKISEGSLYPPLNTSTAEPEVPKVAQPSAPPAPAQAAPVAQKQTGQKPTASTPKSPPRQRHPKPHIDAAIMQMLAMGFTNEGGWLTQLLESKDGNIAAVLDLLTPVNPKK